MPDPYSARGWPRVNTEMRSPLDQFVDRLRALGATDGEVIPGPNPVFRSQSRPEIETPL